MWSPNTRILIHLTVECQSMEEFYRKAHKYLKLENSKEALRKSKGVVANKKNDPGIAPNSSKRQDKR